MPPSSNDTIIKIETRWDTVKIFSKVYVPKYDTVIQVDTFIIKTKVDTLNILKDYFAKYYYKDTIHLDTLGYIIIKDTISQNKIYSRQTFSNLYIPTTTITKTIYLNKREFYLGVALGSSNTQLKYLGGEMLYKNKKYQIYGLGIGIDPEFKPVIMGRTYWKIGK
jgi:hypothetical protein